MQTDGVMQEIQKKRRKKRRAVKVGGKLKQMRDREKRKKEEEKSYSDSYPYECEAMVSCRKCGGEGKSERTKKRGN